MEAPDVFHPVNILETHKGLPPPIRLGYSKAELYDLSSLQSVDKHAIEVASCDHNTFKDLLWHLVYSRNFSDLQKARVIFKWMTTKNLNTVKFEKCGEGSAEAWFTELQNKETTYAKIFALICGYAGLYCVVLTGYAKGKDFHPGDSFEGHSNHSWNAVYIDDNWHFVDTKWAAMSCQNNNTSVNVEDDFFFLTDPNQFIYSHWPHQQEWQFLPRHISLSEFQELPFVKPHFFKCNIQLGWTENPIIHAIHGVSTWTVKYTKPLKFGFKVIPVNGDATRNRKSAALDLKSYVFQETKSDETKLVFRAPKAGQYLFKLFAKSLEPEDAHRHLTEIVEYKLDVKEAAPDAASMPPCAHSVWGPGVRSRKLGLDAVHKGGVVASMEPAVDLKFQKTKPLTVLCKLRRLDVPDSILDRCITVTNKDKIIIHLNLPEVGEYGVDVYASQAKGKKTFMHACQYLVLYLSSEDDMTPFLNNVTGGQINYDSDSSSQSTYSQDEKDTTPAWNIPAMDPLEQPDDDDHSTAPDDFELTTVNFVEAPSFSSAVVSANWSIYDFTDRRVIESLDSHAEQVSANSHDTFKDLMWDLIFSVNVTNDLAKARLIFRWLTSKKIEEISFKTVEKDSPEEVLVWLQSGRSSYAHVYYTMCCFAGIHSRIVHGLAKGATYQIGKPLIPGEHQHWWNAVFIYGRWCLLDAYLATIPLINKTSAGELKYSFNENYFLVDPSNLIYSHFPEDPALQFLSPPVTEEEFITQPKITPHFLQFGLQPVSHKVGILYTQDETEIQLNFPSKRIGLKFVFSLMFSSGKDEYNGTKLNNFGMVECASNNVFVKLSLPEKGTYALHIFAKEDTPSGKDMSFSQVCEYQLIQENEPQTKINPYPPCSSLMWGPGPGFYQLGLTPGNSRAVVHAKHEKGEVKIKMVKPIQLRSQMKLGGGTNPEKSPLVLYKIVDNIASFTVMVSERGKYGLEIYARDPDTQDTEDMRFRQVAQYLIECRGDISDHQLPSLPAGFLGPQPKFIEFGLRTLNNHDPLIELKDTTRLEIQLGTSRDMKFNAHLLEAATGRELSDYIFIQTQPSIVTFLINIPSKGFFKLQIHGNVAEETTNTSIGLFNYLIHCKDADDSVHPFPRQLGHWKEGCYMFEPLVLHSGTKEADVRFRVHVPKAKQVVIFVEQNVHPLDSRGPVQWEGTINLEKYYGTDTKVILAANYGGDDERYATLLEYRV